MELRTFGRCLCFAVAFAVTSSLFVSSSVHAGGLRRIFWNYPCQTQQRYYYTQPAQPAAPATANARGSQYQSFSYEPGTTVTPVAPQATYGTTPSASGSGYRGSMRYEAGSNVPNLFRGDRKTLGLQSN